MRTLSFSGPYFPASGCIGKDTESKCGKIRTRKTPSTDTFHAVLGISCVKLSYVFPVYEVMREYKKSMFSNETKKLWFFMRTIIWIVDQEFPLIKGLSKASLGVGGGDTIPSCFCCCWNVLIGGRWVGTSSFDWLQVMYLELVFFMHIWLVDDSNVFPVVDSSHTNRYLNIILYVSCFTWNFCISKSFRKLEARIFREFLGGGDWVNLNFFINFNFSSASLSACLLPLLW